MQALKFFGFLETLAHHFLCKLSLIFTFCSGSERASMLAVAPLWHTMQCRRGLKGLLSLPWNVGFLTWRPPNHPAACKLHSAQLSKEKKQNPREGSGGLLSRRKETKTKNNSIYEMTSASVSFFSWHCFCLC